MSQFQMKIKKPIIKINLFPWVVIFYKKKKIEKIKIKIKIKILEKNSLKI